jgi:hypothetical protein
VREERLVPSSLPCLHGKTILPLSPFFRNYPDEQPSDFLSDPDRSRESIDLKEKQRRPYSPPEFVVLTPRSGRGAVDGESFAGRRGDAATQQLLAAISRPGPAGTHEQRSIRGKSQGRLFPSVKQPFRDVVSVFVEFAPLPQFFRRDTCPQNQPELSDLLFEGSRHG